jgi:hypothetical protein
VTGSHWLAQLVTPRRILEVTLQRIDTLTDDKMLWQPVDGCMTVRDGVMDPLPREPHYYDGGAADPVTTIAWRLGHIVHDGLLAERNPRWLGVDDVPPPMAVARTAAEWRTNLAAAIDWWSSVVERLDDDHLSTVIGPVGGGYANVPRAGFVIHLKNEAVHHGGEVGVLRDLWRAGLR